MPLRESAGASCKLGMQANSVRLSGVGIVCLALIAWTSFGAPSALAERMAREQARELRNPVGYTAEELREGRKTYLRLCQYCHGADGRAQANPDFEAPSLRTPGTWRYGASDGEMFVSIRDGAGHEMPPFGKQLAEDRIWQLVHYVRSIGPKELRSDSVP